MPAAPSIRTKGFSEAGRQKYLPGQKVYQEQARLSLRVDKEQKRLLSPRGPKFRQPPLSGSEFPSPPPRARAVSLERLKKDERKQAARRRGYASTIMTRGNLLGPAQTQKTKVLG